MLNQNQFNDIAERISLNKSYMEKEFPLNNKLYYNTMSRTLDLLSVLKKNYKEQGGDAEIIDGLKIKFDL